jgi:Rps23 Pro-64 3,4-dihydroxylase Tpa1-like proline 4-hydroxylase
MFLFWLQVSAQLKPAIFSLPEEPVSNHKTIAIIPFYSIEHPADFIKAPDYQTIQDKQIGQELQHSLYKMMMSFSDRFSVKVQDIYTTNDLLQTAGFNDYQFMDMKAVATLLNVDAVVWCVLTHEPEQFLEDPVLKQFLLRQQIPAESQKKDAFLSLFNADGQCFWTLAANSEILRRMMNFENNRMHWFEWMQYMPYWKGDKIKPI